jgi:hypothetical protein
MPSIEHRLRRDRSGWAWELRNVDGEVIDSGVRDTEHQAKAAIQLALFAHELKLRLQPRDGRT